MKTVLLTEDDIVLRSLLKEKLGQAGYQICEAGTGQEALNVINATQVDLILLDLMMPGMDGYTFIYKLKEIGKDNLPIVLLTNVQQTAYPQQVKEYMIKSETPLQTIVATVEKYIGKP